MENVHDDIGFAIQQDDMAADQDVLAIGRGRGEPPFQIHGTRLELFLEPWRKFAAAHKLSFQPWRQPVFLGEAWRKVALMFAIPPANVVVTVPVVVLALVVVISVFVVAFPMSLALCECGAGSQHRKTEPNGKHPLC